jgi:hypothetical protein
MENSAVAYVVARGLVLTAVSVTYKANVPIAANGSVYSNLYKFGEEWTTSSVDTNTWSDVSVGSNTWTTQSVDVNTWSDAAIDSNAWTQQTTGNNAWQQQG